MHIDDIITPALLIDKTKLQRNIIQMQNKAKKGKVALRPHIKTHKCLEIAKLQYEHGASGITAATPAEAQIFIAGGFTDVTLAYPVIPDKFPYLLELAQNATITLLVDHPSMVSALEAYFSAANKTVNVLLKIDCGYHRCGVDPTQPAALQLAQFIESAPHLDFKGILTHAGHAYNASSPDEIAEITQNEQQVMVDFTAKLRDVGLPPEVVSIGSTPTVMTTNKFMKGITEIRPGNYVFFDATQVVLGSCKASDCALTILTSLVSVHSDYIITDAGATTLSKDQGAMHLVPQKQYGLVFADYLRSVINTNLQIEGLSQEHGKIRILRRELDFEYSIGQQLRILPNHSCLTANLFDQYYLVEKEEVVGVWPIQRQRLATPINSSSM
jgi:D-serine deaminase-like pyridoxal phosphate-dependent protein